jgi:hypothetical protein
LNERQNADINLKVRVDGDTITIAFPWDGIQLTRREWLWVRETIDALLEPQESPGFAPDVDWSKPEGKKPMRKMSNDGQHFYEPSQYATERQQITNTAPCGICGNPPGATVHKR